MPLTVEQFVRRLVGSGLMSAEEVEEFINGLPDMSKDLDGEKLARLLVRNKKLTAYQAQQIYSGKGKSLLLGNYLITDKLGEGGMGMVLKAKHKRMKRQVALKVMSAAAMKSPDAVDRFHREVEAAARLEHPNIVAAHDADEANGVHFLVMSYVPGKDLSVLVKEKGPLPADKAVACVLQAARGLEYAHSKGVVHRDIKPANLLLDTEGVVQILDMGLARIDAGDAGQADLTGTGQIMGTVDYMAPEQALSTKTADARSDIYSLGVTLWYLMTGKAAYDGDTLMAKLLAHREAPIPSLMETCDASEGLDAVFQKMAAKSPDDRYQTMTEVIADLEPCQDSPSPPRLGGSSSENRKLSEFLQAGDSAPNTMLPQVKASPATEQLEATLNVDSASVDTSPRTEQMPAPTLNKRPLKPATAKPAPWWANHKVQIVYGITAAGVFLILLAATVFFLKTPSGTLRVEINDPEIEVSIKGSDVVLKGVEIEDVTLRPGEHVFYFYRGYFEFDTTSLILKKRETVVVKVELLDGQVQVASGGKVIGSSLPASATVAETTKPPAPAIVPFDAEQARQHQEAWAKHLGTEVETTNSIGMKMRLIPPGEFLMGSSDKELAKLLEEAKDLPESYKVRIRAGGPQHRVTLTKPFSLATHEVTRSQFRQFVDETSYKTDAERDGNGGLGIKDDQFVHAPEFVWNTKLASGVGTTNDHPVVNVSWNDAVAFCEWLSDKEGATYRLPTEAEWEFACRAGNPGRFSCGDDESKLGEYAWYSHQGGSNTQPVGRKRANSFGLFDLHGNVWEWCSDGSGPYQEGPVVDPVGSTEASHRVQRGGSLGSQSTFVRSAARASMQPKARNCATEGFRPVRTYNLSP